MSSHPQHTQEHKASTGISKSLAEKETSYSELEVENSFLKDQISRLNNELSSYQKQSAAQPPDHHDMDLQQEYATDYKQVSPLLNEYDRRIEELSAFVERQGAVLNALIQRSDDLLTENENLRSRIIPSGIRSNLTNDGFVDASNNGQGNINRNQTTDSKHEIKHLLSDIHLLEEQAELLVKELKDSNQAIATRDKTISSLTSQVEDKLKFIKNLNEKVTRIRKHNIDLEKELLRQVESLASQRSQNKKLEENIENLQKKQDEMSSKVAEVRTDKQHLEKENELLSDKLTNSAVLNQDLQNKLADGINQYNNLNVKYLQLTKELDTVKYDMEHSAHRHAELMLRYNNSREKEKELEELKREQSLKLKELEVNITKAEAKCNAFQDEVNRIVLEKHQGESGRATNLRRKDFSEQLRRRDQTIHMLKMKYAEIEIEAAKDRRESELNRSSLMILERSLKNERIKSRNELEHVNKELSSTSNQLKTEQQQKDEYVNKNSSLQRELALVQSSLNANESELQRVREDDRRKGQEYATHKINLQAKIEDLNAKIIQEVAKLNEEKDTSTLQLEEFVSCREGDTTSIQTKILQLEKSLKESLQSNQNLRNQMKILVKQSTEAERKLQSQLYEKIVKVQDAFDEQVEENKELLSSLRKLSEQKSKLDVLLKQSSSDLAVKDRRLIDAEGRITVLSKQLHDNLSDQSEKVSEIHKLKMELQQLKMNSVREEIIAI